MPQDGHFGHTPPRLQADGRIKTVEPQDFDGTPGKYGPGIFENSHPRGSWIFNNASMTELATDFSSQSPAEIRNLKSEIQPDTSGKSLNAGGVSESGFL